MSFITKFITFVGKNDIMLGRASHNIMFANSCNKFSNKWQLIRDYIYIYTHIQLWGMGGNISIATTAIANNSPHVDSLLYASPFTEKTQQKNKMCLFHTAGMFIQTWTITVFYTHVYTRMCPALNTNTKAILKQLGNTILMLSQNWTGANTCLYLIGLGQMCVFI